MGRSRDKSLATYGEGGAALRKRAGASDSKRLWDLAMSTLSTNTQRAYLGDWTRFAEWWGAPDAPTAVAAFVTLSCGEARELVLAWRRELEARELRPATVARAVRAMNAIVKRLSFAGQCDWTLDVPAPRVETYRDTRGPTDEDWSALIDKTNEDESVKGWRDYAMLLLMRDSAMRRAEVCALDYPDDVDVRHKRVAVIGKGKRDKLWHPISERAKDAIKDWLDVRGREGGPLFCRLPVPDEGEMRRLDGSAIYYIVRKRGAECGVEVKPHGLRHSGITAAAKRWKGSMMGLVRYARHSDPRVTQLYVDDVENAPGEITDLVGDDAEAEK